MNIAVRPPADIVVSNATTLFGGAKLQNNRNDVGRFYLLDVLRGAAALVVVIWHYQHFFFVAPGQYVSGFTTESQPFYFVLEPFYLYGYHAVQLFFVLSGFVFFSQYLQLIKSRQVGPARFFILRFSRLYPLHFATLLFVAGLQLASQRIDGLPIIFPCNDIYHFVLNLFLVSHWGMQTDVSYNAPIWSVSVEVLLYTLFFIFALIAPRPTWMRMTLAVVIAVIGASLRNQIGTAILCFYAGGVVFLLLNSLLKAGWRPIHLAIVATAVLLGAAIIICVNQYGYMFLHGLAFPALVMVIAAAQYAFRGIGKGMRILGDISYSIYLTHFPVQLTLLLAAKIGAISIDYHTTSAIIMFFVLVIAVSVPSYYLFERKAQDYLRFTLGASLSSLFVRHSGGGERPIVGLQLQIGDGGLISPDRCPAKIPVRGARP